MLVEIERHSLQASLAITVTYVVFCFFIGPRFMMNRKPYSLRIPLIIYNIAQIIFNIYMVYMWFSFLGLELFNFSTNICTPLTSAIFPPKLIDKVISTYSYYYFNKITDLLDTVFFILRKKTSQTTTHHIFHHSTMILIAYIGAFLAYDESCIKMFSLNAFVHVIMHSYYLITVLGPSFQKYLYLKKYITIIHLIELVIVTATLLRNLLNCQFATVYVVILLLQVVIQLVLLLPNFYEITYFKKTKRL